MNFPCKRPELAEEGNIPLVCNMLSIKNKPTVHSYLVTFTPELKRDLHPLFMKVASESIKCPFAFDGLNQLVTTEKIDDLDLRFVLGKEKEFNLKIVHKHTSGDEALIIAMYETVVKHYQQLKYLTEGKRSFNKAEVYALSGGVEIHGGLSHCIKSTNHGLFLNLDACFNVFIQERELVDLLLTFYSEREKRASNRLPDENDPFWREASLLLKNCQVFTLHTNFPKKFKISGILPKPANQTTFNKDGNDISVASYFESTYGKLKYPHYPVVVVKKQGKESYFPIEVLKVSENQKYTRKLDEMQTAEMIKHAAKVPTERFMFINSRIKDLQMAQNEVLTNFNLVIDNKFKECKGKLLPVPEAIFGEQRRVKCELSKGQVSIQKVKFIKPVKINKLSVISLLQVDKHSLEEGIRSLSNVGKLYGMSIPTNYSYFSVGSPDEYEKALKKEQSDLVIVILPTKTSHIYNKIKNVAETSYGMITQCLLAKNINKLTKIAFAANVLLKINAKLGGSNLIMENKLLKRPTMIIAADVTHPGIGDLESPSIVALVSSYDSSLTKYNTYIFSQQRRTEIIDDLGNVIKKSIISFVKHNKIEPEKIIFFRDGVGDSQFYSVFESEYKAVKEACASYKSGYAPEVNVIVVQKRHSLRFLLGSSSSGLTGGLEKNLEKMNVSGLKGGYEQRRNYDDRRGGYDQRRGGYDQRRGGYDDQKKSGDSGNVSPGTVVEDIGHPYFYDFYMVSHYALQGTARPIRYQVLVNESKYSNSELQEFIHNLSYLYQRSNKAVAGPAPVRYAHLAALRAKAYVEKVDDTVRVRQPYENLTENLYYL